ncbi:insulinase family protein [Marinomonas algarum]|uniref:Protease 3 n=1 Tax=Marinomonas algarum TaxID=2883105 RepID=A0A9X1LDZ9_9GAMM|nr:insulinase family protein [Marinomonas algarum]MCB5160663.1 insulinase family protein [Marinomonas algarum]
MTTPPPQNLTNSDFSAMDMPSSLPLDKVTAVLKKSLTDQNNYHHMTLDNGLKVLLVNDPKAEQFSASLSVGVGNFQDPDDQQGLAHFLEHMLFLGTEKYPDPGSYQTYIHTHGGSHNAYTSTDTTNFYFDVKPLAFEGALDRFSQFFIAPLFSEELTQREKNAVDAEYKAKLKEEGRRNAQAFKTLINPDHPYSHFTVGNLDTLKDRPHKALRKQLLDLYNAYYHSDNMALVMVANLDNRRMAALAKRYFSDIPQKKKTKPLQYPALISPRPLQSNRAPQLQFVRSLADSNIMTLYYQIDAQEKHYETQPTRYLSYILGNENKGSLYAELKSEGLINALSVGITPDYGNHAFLKVAFRLTNEGLDNIDRVAQQFFATLSLLKSSPVNNLYLTEGVQLSQLMFDNQNYVNPQDLARSLSARLLTTPATDILSCFRLEKAATVEHIEQLLKQLTPQNLLIQVVSDKHFPEQWSDQTVLWQTEPWYHTEYSNLPLGHDFLSMMERDIKNTHVSLPEKNVFIPDSLALITEQQDVPSVVFQKHGFTYWNKSGHSFGKPTAMNFVGLRFDHAADSARNALLNRLWTRLFNDSVSDETYAPYVAGLGYALYPHSNGITLRTSGYSDKQNTFTTWLIDQFFLFQPTQERFEQIKSQLDKDLANHNNQQAFRNANSAFSTLITKDSSTIEALANELPTVTIKELNNYIKSARQDFDVVGYSTGNVTKQQSKQLANSLYQRFTGRLNTRKPIEIETKTITAHKKYHHRFDSTSNDSVVLYTLIDTSTQTRSKAIIEKAYFSLLRRLIGSAFYHELRTQQQLGYIVGAQNLSIRNTPILGLLVQSPDKDTAALIQAIEHFLDEQTQALTEVSEDAFNQVKHALLGELKMTAKNLSDNALSEWRQIAKAEPDFHTQQEWIKNVENIKRKDFIAYIKHKLERNDIATIVVHNQRFPEDLIKQEKWEPISASDNHL